MSSPSWRAADLEKVRGYWRAYYYRNRDEIAAARRRRKRDLRVWLREFKSALRCEDCAERHPGVLDFHHTVVSEKERAIGEVVEQGWSRRKVLEEIAKCEILCANCHRKRHWSELRTLEVAAATE